MKSSMKHRIPPSGHSSRCIGVVILALALGGCYRVDTQIDAPDASPGDGTCARALTAQESRDGLRPPRIPQGLTTLLRDAAGRLGGVELAKAANGDPATIERLRTRLASTPAGSALWRLFVPIDGPGRGGPDGFGTERARLCTLRAAIMEANAWPWKSVITVPAGIYNLALPSAQGGGSLRVNRNMRIQGSGAQATIVDGLNGTNVFLIDGTANDVEINHLTIQGGVGAAGAGIYLNRGTTELEDIVVRDNSADTGGGGLVVNGSATAYVRRSTFSENYAIGAFGGAVWNVGSLWIYDSTISGNDSNRAGGIHNSGQMNLRNVTVSGNLAHSPDAGVGGIRQWGFAVLNNVTITGNEGIGSDPAFDQGGGITTSAGGTTVMKNSIVAGNDGHGGPNDCVGELAPDSTHNLIGDSTGCVISGSLADYVLDVPAELGSLAFNGGSTMTHLPLSGSPARDAGYGFPPPAADACEPVDQRGVPRPQGAGSCDIGAVEYSEAFVSVTSFILVDAATNTDIGPLRNDDWLVLSQLPPQLSIRVTTNGVPGSVVFGFDGNPAYNTENLAPYALAGDAAGDYAPVVLTGGQHTVSATPHTAANGAGAAGAGRSIRFNVLQVN